MRSVGNRVEARHHHKHINQQNPVLLDGYPAAVHERFEMGSLFFGPLSMRSFLLELMLRLTLSLQHLEVVRLGKQKPVKYD